MSGSPDRRGFAVVTGAARRLGAAFAEALAEDGWFVRLHHNTSRREAEETAARIVARGGRCDLAQAELTAPEGARAIFESRGEPGFASLLVNSASLFEFDSPADATPHRLERMYAVNAVAPVLLTQALAAQLPDDAKGLAVNLLDQKLAQLNPDFFAYTMSKAALHAATTMMAQSLAPRVRVNAISPGITLPSADQTPAEFEVASRTPPLGRGSSPAELVRALRYLVDAEAVTGQNLIVDGGQSLAPAARDVMFTIRGEG
ncbi:MAG: SDR family oxidoreductase [Alphaproteobacteria bacterium]|nr:SDR family oxidoreductase [Alphaproteobacteria bacterium]